ncbi:MAG: 5'/3'-nucleotidase SurE [Pirellula sp.]
MRILITNDDGYDAEGLQRLVEQLSADHDCFVVAPDQGRSCCGHSVTNAAELEVIRKREQHWTISGTPADCVRIGLMVLGIKPDWVISGVNHGGNMGIDTLYSGTVAAARESTILGYKSIAISQYMRRDVDKDWNATAKRGRRVLYDLWDQQLNDGFFWNINLPALPPDHDSEFPITYCPLELGPLPISYQASQEQLSNDQEDLLASQQSQRVTESIEGAITRHLYQSNYQMRPRKEGTDVHYCFSGHAVITRLQAFGFCPHGC